jgi:predicted transposase/invertase (TIGR01784 family)
MPSLAERLRYEGKEQGFIKGYKQGFKEGFKQGIEQGAKLIARRMLNDNAPIESIIKYTGLTEKQIKELREDVEL